MPVDVRRIGTVDVAVLEQEEAFSLAETAIESGRASLVCFANAHTVNTARQDSGFTAALQRALVLNDGIGIDLASQWIYRRPFPANLNGTDFVPALLNRLPAGTRVFLLGGKPGVAERAGDAIRERHPHIVLAGAEHGYFGPEDEDALLDRIASSGAAAVLVAMGHPRQEIWAATHVDRIDRTVFCVGALLDFYAGTATRAPEWMRRARIEWMFRLSREPKRLARRYLIGNATFLAHTLAARRQPG